MLGSVETTCNVVQYHQSSTNAIFDAGAACGLLCSRHLVVKIKDFTDFHPILSVFSAIFEKIRALVYTQ